jgi:hypothetical protein
MKHAGCISGGVEGMAVPSFATLIVERFPETAMLTILAEYYRFLRLRIMADSSNYRLRESRPPAHGPAYRRPKWGSAGYSTS